MNEYEKNNKLAKQYPWLNNTVEKMNIQTVYCLSIKSVSLKYFFFLNDDKFILLETLKYQNNDIKLYDRPICML